MNQITTLRYNIRKGNYAETLKSLSYALPTTAFVLAGSVFYFTRRSYLQDPVLQRGLLHLKKDQTVVDFCGENIKPLLWITKDYRAGESWITYELKVKGSAGKMSAKIIGDYLTHGDLEELECERQEYFSKKEMEAARAAESGDAAKSSATDIDPDYIPIDFDAYTIIDKATDRDGEDKTYELPKSEKIWRISSLTTSTDPTTRMMVLPKDERRRAVKIIDTKYDLRTYKDLFTTSATFEDNLMKAVEEVKRYEDKT